MKAFAMFGLSFSRIRVLGAVVVTLQFTAACGRAGDPVVAGVGSGGTGFVSGAVTKGPVGSTAWRARGQLGYPGQKMEGRGLTSFVSAQTSAFGSRSFPPSLDLARTSNQMAPCPPRRPVLLRGIDSNAAFTQ